MLHQELLPPIDRRAVEQPEQALALLMDTRRDAGRIGEGPGEVDVEREPVFDRTVRGHAVIPHHHRDPDRFLVGRLLVEEAVFASEQSVVGRVDDQGVVDPPGIGERRHDRTDRVVHGEQRATDLDPRFRLGGGVEEVLPATQPGLSPRSASLNEGGGPVCPGT